NLEKYFTSEAFAGEHGIDFYPAGTGISHQVMVEQGYVVPGALVVASDSHSNLYGAAAALGTPVVRTDAASIWATGVTWWQVPKVAKVVLKGTLSPGVVGKDVIIALCGLFNKDEVLNHAVEFSADADAEYAIELELDLATVVPHVSGPNEVKTMVSLPEMERKRVAIQKAYLLSCVNARFEDLHDAAEVVRAKSGHVADGVEFYLAPASAEVQARSESTGDWQTLIGAGAIPLPPGGGACIGLGRGLVRI